METAVQVDTPVVARSGSAHRHKPAPPAFAEVFIRVGWRGVEEAYGSRTGCNRRWIDDCGGETLFALRREYRQRLRQLRAGQRSARA
ncbi:hypothetical protein KK137_06395 [Croceibacterium sp. LX-88]|uniref:Transposase n=1 Tax=Croceibacterium selenioxidans TaxID=2838833 RepID=A0ABS5W6E7_9SPHN|nr:hypothetical protein [Croceibacterium selenioxidans]MBT2133959.1 hypothetical protein [Croceibacterium selenioxidans]